MSDPTEQTSDRGVDLPPTLRAERDQPPFPKRPWYLGIGPAYLTIFVWAPFFDPLWMGDLTRGGLLWLVGLAVVSSMTCYALFFYPMAIWGHRHGRGLGVMAASTFGTSGSEWITGVGIGVAEVVWYAVAISYAVESTLLGLVTCDLIPSDVLGHWVVGPVSLRTPVFLCTAAFWIFITGSASLLRLIAVIAALMKIYAPVALLLLTAAALWVAPGLGSYRLEDAIVVADRSGVIDRGPGASVLPLFTGFFALIGLSSLDWGAGAPRRRDVTVGGLAGIVLAGAWTATMSLLVVAGAVVRLVEAGPARPLTAADPPLFSFRWGIVHGIGGYPAAVILILFGLAALAPACYSVWGYSSRFAARWSLSRRKKLTWGLGAIALVMIALSWPSRLETIDYVMGLVFAPVLGALAGDFLSQRGGWAGVRRGVNPAGLIAWLAGMASRFAGDMAASRSPWPGSEFWSSPIIGFMTGAFVYWLLARTRLEGPSIPLSTAVLPDVQDGTATVEVPAATDVLNERIYSEPRPSESGPEGQS